MALPQNSNRELVTAISSIRRQFVYVGLFSFVVNILMLTGPIFMLQIYDRVISSGSVDTLIALCILVVALYGFMGIVDVMRSRVLVSVGHRFDQSLGAIALRSDLSAPLRLGAQADTQDALGSVAQLRNFLGGPAIIALFDMPWIPIYLAVVFAMHFWLGMVGLGQIRIILGHSRML